MLSDQQALRFEQTVEAPVGEVYRAFTNATALREWMCDVATVDPKPGGRFYAAWNNDFYACGEYTALEPEQQRQGQPGLQDEEGIRIPGQPGSEQGFGNQQPDHRALDRRVVFTWHGRGYPDSTQVQVSLSPVSGGTQVRLEHSGFGMGEDWGKTRQEISRGWKSSLENLASVMKTGEDQRFTRRPMLGINVGQFTPEDAKQLEVPVTEGIRLDGVLEEMGAYAAGLRSGDVIVEMAGKPVTSFASLAGVLQGHKAGDVVEVVFYRGPEKRTVSMELSRRPLPEIPAAPKMLAERVRERFAAQENEWRPVFENLSEEQASYRPAPGEWNSKEIIAHLILGERFLGYYIEELETGYERWADGFGANSHAHTRGVVDANPTLGELVEDLQRSQAEVVGTLEALGDAFTHRKGSYWRLAYNLLQPDTHFLQHVEEIRSLAETAGR